MNSEQLLKLYDRISEANDAVPKLRQLVIDLAVRGKLVPQDPNDEPAEELLSKIDVDPKIQKKEELTKSLDSKSPFLIPKTWEWTTTSKISLKLHYGYTASAKFIETGVRLLRITDIQNDLVNWNKVPFCEIEPKNLPKYKLEVNDLLIARTGGTIGKTFLVSEMPVKSVFASYLIRIQLSKVLNALYIKLFYNSSLYWTQLAAGSRGGAQPNVNGKTLGGMLLPMPPLAEQHRIVAKVDELMALLDQLEQARTARETKRDRLTAATLGRLSEPDSAPEVFRGHATFAINTLPKLSTRPDQIKALRQTVLNLAVRGKLVPQDPNDEPAEELLKQIKELRSTIFTDTVASEEQPFQLPDGWSWSRICEICSKTGSGSTPRGGKSAYFPTGVPFLRSQNIYNDGLKLNDVVFINEETHQKMKGTHVLPQDLLLNITGGSIGRCCYVSKDFQRANISQHVAIIRPHILSIGIFLHKLIISPYFQNFIWSEQTGAGREGLPKKRMDKIIIPLPPLAEQHRIVDKVDELMVLFDQLESALTTADKKRAQLLEAVLHETLSEESKEEIAEVIN
jgi:type I restriction enzyme S subunit